MHPMTPKTPKRMTPPRRSPRRSYPFPAGAGRRKRAGKRRTATTPNPKFHRERGLLRACAPARRKLREANYLFRLIPVTRPREGMNLGYVQKLIYCGLFRPTPAQGGSKWPKVVRGGFSRSRAAADAHNGGAGTARLKGRARGDEFRAPARRACCDLFALALHDAILAQPPRAVHRTMVRGVKSVSPAVARRGAL